MTPPWVGSGCRVTRVATGSRSTGTASSPTSRSPSAVVSSIGVRVAGSTVPARISSGPPYVDRWWSVTASVPRGVARPLRLGATPAASVPAGGVPVPSVTQPGVGVLVVAEGRRPRDAVRRRGPDPVVAARAPVGAGRGRTGDLPHHPLVVVAHRRAAQL